MGKLNYLIIHCSATQEGKHYTIDDIKRWHTAPKPNGRGWRQVGYSDAIYLDGSLHNLVSYNNDNIVQGWEITNGVRGINGLSRHVVYIGGIDSKGNAKDTRTLDQSITLEQYVKKTILIHPDIKVAGHNQFAAKACPSFDVPKWLRSIGIEEQNIYK